MDCLFVSHTGSKLLLRMLTSQLLIPWQRLQKYVYHFLYSSWINLRLKALFLEWSSGTNACSPAQNYEKGLVEVKCYIRTLCAPLPPPSCSNFLCNILFNHLSNFCTYFSFTLYFIYCNLFILVIFNFLNYLFCKIYKEKTQDKTSFCFLVSSLNQLQHIWSMVDMF